MMTKTYLKLLLSCLVLLCVTASIIVIFSASVSVSEAQSAKVGIYSMTGCECPVWPADCGCPPGG